MSLFAISSSLLTVVRDLSPGGHHGAALLALSQLVSSTWRLVPGAKTTKQRQIVTTVVCLPAALFAGFEMLSDLQPGAHHAVALLAAAELIENTQRTKGALRL